MRPAWTRARLVAASVAVVLAALLLFFSLRGIDWREAGRLIRGASFRYLLVAGGISTATLFLRAVRWRVLLNAEGQISIPTAFWATAAGYFGNNFLPARAGELVRTFMISSRAPLDGAFVLTTALAERVADAIVLVLISAGILLALPAPPGWFGSASRPFAIAGVIGVLAIAVLPRLEAQGRRIVQGTPLPLHVRSAAVNAIGQIVRGLRSFHDAGRLAAFLALTAIIWSLDAVGAVIGGAALGLAIPLPAAFLLITGLSLGSALPSTPGYVGIYQFVAVTVLTPFGLTRTDAIAFILVAQVLMYAVIGCWGAAGFARYRRAV